MSPSPSSASGRSGSNAGPRALLWVVLVLSALILGTVTALAVHSNPLYSDTSRNVISKYRFIEECKDQLHAQLQRFEQSQGGAPITSSFDARDLVAGTASNPQKPGWVLVSQVKLSRAGFPSQSVPFGCQSDEQGRVTLPTQ